MTNKMKIKKLISVFIFISLLITFSGVFGQSPDGIEMADALRADGKIYVVVTVLSVIFIGLSIYLFRLDRRITKMEKEKKS